MGNSSTIQIEIRVDGKGGIKVLRQIGKESDKTGKTGSKAFRKMDRSVGALNKQINLTRGLATKLGAAFGLWKLWQVSQGFLNVAVQTENYKLRLNALLGSVSEGNRMFQEMSKFAGEVPFTYDQIMASATQLSGVMRGGIEEIKQWMPLIADLAAVSGLDIQTATEQIIRMYSAGAASADLFRERGITAMLGFQAKVSYSAEETRKRLMAAWKDPESKFKDATKEMAKSWAGLVSMLGDKWFQFRSQVMESGPFMVMKEHLGILLKEIDRLKKNGQLDIWAADMADGVLAAVDLMMLGFQGLSKAVYGFRAIFGVMAERYYKNRINSINLAIQGLENLVQKNVNVELNQRQIDDLKAQRAEMLLNKAAGADMAMGNIRKMDEYSQKIQGARDKLARLRADMEARRGERPETAADLSISKKTTVPGPDAQALKNYKALMTEVEKAQKEFQDALIIPSGTLEIMENQLRRGIGADITVRDTEKIREAYAAMYSDLKFQSDEYYPYQLEQLQRQAEDYETYTGDAALAHQWLCEQIKILDKERLEAAQKNNKYLVDMSERTAEAIEDNFSQFYRDAFRGELDSAADYFRAFCHSLTDSFSDMLGQMTKEMLFGGGSSGSSGMFSSLLSGIGNWFGGGTFLDANAGLGADWAGTLWHGGGRVGRDPAPTRNVPASVFANAPRLHQGYPGLARDEFPSILKYDETVLPPGVKPVNNVSNLTISVPVTIEGQGDDRLASKLSYEMEETAKRVMREEMR